MQANVTKIQQLLEKTQQFMVPLFQRPYSWDKKHWQTLWKDLVNLYEDEKLKTHFIGSMVTLPAQISPEGLTKYLLIDGQQRMTTILVILCALRDCVKETDGMFAKQIQALLLNPQAQNDDHFKLLPTQADRKEFFEIININKSVKYSSQITKAYEFFCKKLQETKIIKVEKIKEILVNQLSIVSIVLDQDEDPHLIFESLNAKGRALTQSDLIKNYFLMQINTNKQQMIFDQIWYPLESRLLNETTNFFRHFLAQNYLNLRQDEVYFTLKNSCDRENEEEIIQQLKVFERFSQYYEQFIYPDRCQNPDFSSKLKGLQLFDVSTCYPFLLSVFERLSANNLQEKEVLETLTLIENFIVRRDICGISTNSLNKIFATLDRQIGPTTNFCKRLTEILMTKNYPADQEFITRLMSTKLYGTNQKQRKTKYILGRLENFDHKEIINLENLTIEHVMPQTLNDWWKKHLGEKWKEVHSINLHTLGNLTLTGYNGELSNLNFAKKKQILRDSKLQINDYFTNCENWKEENIKQRAKLMAEKALKLWPNFANPLHLSTKINEKVTGLKPIQVSILGQSTHVSSWREVAQITLKKLFTINSDHIESAVDIFPSYLSKNKNKLRAPYELANSIYMEQNLSAEDIYRFCQQITTLFEVPPGEFKIETNKK